MNLTLAITTLAALAVGVVLGLLAARVRLWRIEAELRALANGMSMYETLDHPLTAGWLQEQIDHLVDTEFR